MMGPLPGLATGLMTWATMLLAGAGLLVHLLVAAVLGKRSQNALSTALGPVACFFVGVVGGSVGQIDDMALAIPIVGISAWILISSTLGLRGMVRKRGE